MAEGTLTPGAARLSLFGGFELTGHDGVAITIANRRARALLAMLALEPDRPLARDQIIKLLWPGRFEAQARASLRQCLLELGKALEPVGQPVLDVTREQVGLVTGSVRSDLGELEQALAAGRTQAAITALRLIGPKPLLDRLSFGDPFSQWLSRSANG